MALTKVTGQVINNTTGLVVGVTTVGGGLSATNGFFSGIVTAVGDASFSGNVSVGGTLTYEDVTNIDSVGLITARNGIVVGSGITLSKDGDIFATGVTTSTTFVGNLTGNVTGNSDTATNSTNSSHILVTDNESTNENNLITFVEDATSSTGNVGLEMDGNLTYNPSTGTVSATIFSGSTGTFTGAVTDSKGNLRSIPLNNQASAYTLVAADAGKTVSSNGGTITVDANVMSSGDAVTLINNSGSDQTITQGSGLSIYNTADGSTGNRTLAARGMATIYFFSATVAYISGAGLS